MATKTLDDTNIASYIFSRVLIVRIEILANGDLKIGSMVQHCVYDWGHACNQACPHFGSPIRKNGMVDILICWQTRISCVEEDFVETSKTGSTDLVIPLDVDGLPKICVAFFFNLPLFLSLDQVLSETQDEEPSPSQTVTIPLR